VNTLHGDVASLGFLLGAWRGTGHGEYPTIDPFDYEEELVFEHVGEAWLAYRQASWAPSTGEALHLERGFLRPGAEPGAVELVLAHPIGVAEVAHGAVDGTSLEVATLDGGIIRSGTGLHVAGLVRRYRVDGSRLAYELDMATDRTPMARHLTGTLERVP
jgi:hypothetical protein